MQNLSCMLLPIAVQYSPSQPIKSENGICFHYLHVRSNKIGLEGCNALGAALIELSQLKQLNLR